MIDLRNDCAGYRSSCHSERVIDIGMDMLRWRSRSAGESDSLYVTEK
jgi:hypothetical protein